MRKDYSDEVARGIAKYKVAKIKAKFLLLFMALGIGAPVMYFMILNPINVNTRSKPQSFVAPIIRQIKA